MIIDDLDIRMFERRRELEGISRLPNRRLIGILIEFSLVLQQQLADLIDICLQFLPSLLVAGGNRANDIILRQLSIILLGIQQTRYLPNRLGILQRIHNG